MKACLTALILCGASWHFQCLAADQTEAERKLLAEIRAKADRGDGQSQFDMGLVFASGRMGVAKDEGEAVKWFRKAAEQGRAEAQNNLAVMLENGEGTPVDRVESAKWYHKAAEQGIAVAQHALAFRFKTGDGVGRNPTEAVRWYRRAAEQGLEKAQVNLGIMYASGDGVSKDEAEAVRWYRIAAEQGSDAGQNNLGTMYFQGRGTERDFVEAYAWWNLSATTSQTAAKNRDGAEQLMTPQQVAEAQRRTKELRALVAARIKAAKPSYPFDQFDPIPADAKPKSSGTGFFISETGYFITNQHVAGEGAKVRLVTATGTIAAQVVKVDKANDLALLKAEGKFTALPVIPSRGVRLGATAATVGFPNTGLQGFAPKLAKGEIASLAGAQDDARHFQISAPIQPGNSGGALVDERGNIIGVVVAKLSQRAALATSGALAENVNYAVKSSYLLSFLESVPEVAAKLKEAHTKDRKFEDVVKSVEQATVLVLVY